MTAQRVCVLGAYGQVGRSVTRVLAEQTDVTIVLAGRRLERAQALAHDVGRPDRVTACLADAAKPETLQTAFRGADLVINTATARHCVEQLARACLACGCDLVDCLETEETVLQLRALEDEIRGARRLVVTQCGLAPGASGAMLRQANASFARMRRARLGMAFSLQTIERKEQVYDIFEFVVKNQPVVYEGGRWQSRSLSADRVVIDCGPRFGLRPALPLDMFETRELPGKLGLESFGYYATGANRIVDLLVRRLLKGLHVVKPRLGWSLLASLALGLAKRSRNEPRGGAVVVEGEGEGGQGRSLHMLIDVEDNYLGVGTAVVVVARQLLAGAFRGTTGVHLMGELIDPARTLADLAALGIPCRQTWRPTPLAG